MINRVRALISADEPADTKDRLERKRSEIQRSQTRQRLILGAIIVVLSVIFNQAIDVVGFSIRELVRYLPEFRVALTQYFPIARYAGIPVGLDVGQYWEFVEQRGLFEPAILTLSIGFAGSALGLPGALLFGILGSERIVPYPFNLLFRGTMSVIRAIPALVWMLIFIPLGGVGPFTATLAVATDTIGNLGRLFSDELEEIDDGAIEGIKSTGASFSQTVYFGMLSQVFRPFLAWILYILEINVRIAVALGIIGAGGLGYTLSVERGLFHYTNMMATILMIMVLVISVEIFSQRTRSYLRKDDSVERMGLLERIITAPRRILSSMGR